MAVSFAVPESSRWSTDWVGVTGGVDGGVVGPPDGGGVVEGGVAGGFGFVGPVPGALGEVVPGVDVEGAEGVEPPVLP
ncbi:hypothetical protein, partial [Streptomyces shaanxiensis]